MLWRAVGRETEWKESRCRHVQIPELFSVPKCSQAMNGLPCGHKSGSSHTAMQSRVYLAVIRLVSFGFQVRPFMYFRFILDGKEEKGSKTRKGRNSGAPQLVGDPEGERNQVTIL